MSAGGPAAALPPLTRQHPLPLQAGSYCPATGESFTCPENFYCRAGSMQPKRCPVLTSCPAGSSKASLSWSGFIAVFGSLLVLWVAYACSMALIRVRQRRLLRTQEARDRLSRLLNPLFAPSQQHSRCGLGGGGTISSTCLFPINQLSSCCATHPAYAAGRATASVPSRPSAPS